MEKNLNNISRSSDVEEVRQFFYDLLVEAERRNLFCFCDHVDLVQLADFLGDRLFYSNRYLPKGYIDVRADCYKSLQESSSILLRINGILADFYGVEVDF